jgi:hypothetical protein
MERLQTNTKFQEKKTGKRNEESGMWQELTQKLERVRRTIEGTVQQKRAVEGFGSLIWRAVACEGGRKACKHA